MGVNDLPNWLRYAFNFSIIFLIISFVPFAQYLSILPINILTPLLGEDALIKNEGSGSVFILLTLLGYLFIIIFWGIIGAIIGLIKRKKEY